MLARLALVAGLLCAVDARADDPPPPASVETRLQAIEAENARLRKLLEENSARLERQLELLREEHETTKEQVKRLLPLHDLLTGYADIGFFYVGGDGSGSETALIGDGDGELELAQIHR